MAVSDRALTPRPSLIHLYFLQYPTNNFKSGHLFDYFSSAGDKVLKLGCGAQLHMLVVPELYENSVISVIVILIVTTHVSNYNCFN